MRDEETTIKYLSGQVVRLATSEYKRFEGKPLNPLATHRQIMRDEVVIEYDYEPDVNEHETQVALYKLEAAGYRVHVYDHGGRSKHIHIYGIKGLDELDDELREEYKFVFLSLFAGANCDKSLKGSAHLIACEFREHYKTGNVKRLTKIINPDSENKVDPDIALVAVDNLEVMSEMGRDQSYEDDPEWFVNWMMNEKQSIGGIHNQLFKNLAIAIVNHGYDEERVVMNTAKHYGRQAVQQITSWIGWVRKGKTKSFNEAEIRSYMERHELNIDEVKSRWDVPDLKTF